MNYKIYTLSLLSDPDNIKYVGLTGKSLNHRLKGHINACKYSNNKRTNWVAKYSNNIIIKELASNLNLEEAKLKEIEYIKYYRDNNYDLINSTDGGDGVCGYKPSLQTREKQRLAKLKNPTKYWEGKKRDKIEGFGKGRPFGYKVSEETKKKLKLAHSGKTLSKEHIEKLSLLKIGIENKHLKKKIIVYDKLDNKELTFNSHKEFFNSVKCNRTSLYKYINRKSKTPFMGRYIIK